VQLTGQTFNGILHQQPHLVKRLIMMMIVIMMRFIIGIGMLAFEKSIQNTSDLVISKTDLFGKVLMQLKSSRCC
jgi:hypothetical protein